MALLEVLVVRRETAAALQVVAANHHIYWLPRSQIIGEFKAGDRDIVMELPGWLLEEKQREYDWGNEWNEELHSPPERATSAVT